MNSLRAEMFLGIVAVVHERSLGGLFLVECECTICYHRGCSV